MAGRDPTRRDFLTAAGVAGLGAALTGCERGDPFSPRKQPVPGSATWLRGEERHISTSCGQCDSGCGIQVRVVEGRAVSVAGNPVCPINRGGVGPRGLSAPQVLYDPDRVRQPMRLVGARGSGDWEPIGWEEAIGLLSDRLIDLRRRGEAHRAGVLCGRERGIVRELLRRFANAFGTPNFFEANSTSDGAVLGALRLMQGIAEVPAHDWENVHLVLSLGSGVLDASCQLLHFARARSGRRGGAGRARIVHVGPALSRTAMNADEWVSTRSGTHGAFALGLSHVLVRDGLHDLEFVEEHCSGFDDWEDESGRAHSGFASLLEDYDPERVAQICGVEADVIEQVAVWLTEGPAELRPLR